MKFGQAELVFQRVRLRPLSPEDIETTRVWRNRDDTRRWFKHAGFITAEQQRDWFSAYLERDDDFVWLVEDRDRPGIALGQAALYAIGQPSGEGEIGRFIAAPEARRRGYLSAACRGLLHHAFVDLGLGRLRLEVFRENRCAMTLYRSCRFQETGQDADLVYMILTRNDWDASNHNTTEPPS